jgi:hypothetical protein
VKKITAILLLCIYSFSTLGLSLKSFYCCGNLESVTVSISQDEQQKCKDYDGTSDCCQTKYQFYKVKDNHFVGDHIDSPVKQFVVLDLFTSNFQIVNYPSELINPTSQSKIPPLIHGVPDYIFNCVFRI